MGDKSINFKPFKEGERERQRERGSKGTNYIEVWALGSPSTFQISPLYFIKIL